MSVVDGPPPAATGVENENAELNTPPPPRVDPAAELELGPGTALEVFPVFESGNCSGNALGCSPAIVAG